MTYLLFLEKKIIETINHDLIPGRIKRPERIVVFI